MHLGRNEFLVSQTRADKEKKLNYQKRSFNKEQVHVYETVQLFLYIEISTYTIFHSIKVVEAIEKYGEMMHLGNNERSFPKISVPSYVLNSIPLTGYFILFLTVDCEKVYDR